MQELGVKPDAPEVEMQPIDLLPREPRPIVQAPEAA
jgi:hypothetical protein